MKNSHVTLLEIDAEALNFNLNYFKSKLKKETKLLIVIKAFGYGSDAIKIAHFLAKKVAYFAVAYLDEGIALRNSGITTPILVLHPQKANLEKLVTYNLEPNIYSLQLLNSFLKVSKKLKLTNYPIHIKINTGLNRLGFSEARIPEIISLVNNQSNLKVTSIFSHIAASEDLNEKEFTLHQIEKFKSISKELIKQLNYKVFRHMLNTSGILNYVDEAQFDMVRLGIGLYGFGNNPIYNNQLKNVITLKSVISQIQTIKIGETVGYNRAFKATKQIKIATIPIGHADGISRQFGNGVGYIFINHKKAKIVGNVCMDMLMVDVTDIECNEGDEVLIYKNQEHIQSLAKSIDTIPYELLTAISQRVNRLLK